MGVSSHPTVGLGWLLTLGGVQAAPGVVGAWPATKICFLLAVLSFEGGRTIWSPLRRPNKPGNAGQALQIPLTAVGRRAEPAAGA